MKLCILTARFPPQRCGIGDYSYFLGSALARAGHQVDIVTSVGPLDEALYPASEGLRMHRVVRGWGTHDLPQILRHVRRLHADVLYLQYTPQAFDRRGMTFAINAVPLLTRAFTATRVVTNFHELFISLHGSLKRRLGASWQRAAVLAMAFGSHAIGVTDTEWKRRLRALGVRKSISVIPVGSNIPDIQVSQEERARLRSELLHGREGLLVVGFGAWYDRNIPAILYGLSRLLKKRHARLLWIGGEDTLPRHRAPVEAAMHRYGIREEDVHWAGAVSHPTASRFISAGDMMVLPFMDGVSTRRTTAISALQHGVPLLTTRGADPERYFVHGATAFLVPPGEDDALAEGIMMLADQPELRERLSAGGQSLYSSTFSWEAIARQVSGFLHGRQAAVPERRETLA